MKERLYWILIVIITIFTLVVMFTVSNSYAAKNWPASCLEGVNCLDDIDKANLTDGDRAWVMIKEGSPSEYKVYFFIYDASSSATESVPRIIATQEGGTGRWILGDLYFQTIQGQSADGERYINYSNSATLPSSPSDADQSTRSDVDVEFVYDAGDAAWGYQPTIRYKEYSATGQVATKYCYGGVVSGTTLNIDLTLPTLTTGTEYYRCTFFYKSVAFQIYADTGDVITGTGAGGYIDINTPLDAVTLQSINASTWVVIMESGTPAYP